MTVSCLPLMTISAAVLKDAYSKARRRAPLPRMTAGTAQRNAAAGIRLAFTIMDSQSSLSR
jgi:hypothetical protein